MCSLDQCVDVVISADLLHLTPRYSYRQVRVAQWCNMKNGLLKRTAILSISAILLALTFLFTSLFFVTTQTGQLIDQRAFNGALFGQRSVAPPTLVLLDALPITGVAVALIVSILIAIVRHNGRVLLVAMGAAAAANLFTQLCKHVLLDRPDLGIDGYADNSLPSGHTALAASSVLVVFLVSSQRTRPIAAMVGAFFTASVGVSTLANQWHRPSDVVAALLAVSFFGCLAGLVIIRSRFAHEAPARDVQSRVLLFLSLPCAAVASATLLVSAFEPFAYIGAAAGIAACALLLSAAANRAFRFIR